MKNVLSILAAALVAVSVFASATFTVSAAATDVLAGKTAMFIGDDISYGLRDGQKLQGWSGRLKNYGLKTTAMHASAGVTVSDWRKNKSGTIISQIPALGSAKYDYVILHGGMADAEKNETGIEGVATGAVFPHDFSIPEKPQDQDAYTFAKGMERLIQAAITRYNGARIGFIINYATPNNSCANARDMEKYWAVARQACDKWDIPYLDLYAGKTSDGKSYSYDILDMGNPKSPNHNNDKHLRAPGYDVITPYIAEWMATLQPYHLEEALATAPTTTTSKRKTTTTTTTNTAKVPTKTDAKATTTTVKDGDSSSDVESQPTTTKQDADEETQMITTTTVSAGNESSPNSSDVVADPITENDDVLPIVLTAVAVAAAAAVLVVLVIVAIKRFRS